MPDRFFSHAPLAVGDFTLDGPEAHHLATVLRAQPGQSVILFDGYGSEFHATILAASKKLIHFEILEERMIDRERAETVIIAAAMPKGDRGDFLIEKLVELGASRFVPLITDRTVVVPKESRIESLRRTVIEASKQCGRNVLMTVEEPQAWKQFCERSDLPAAKWLLHPGGEAYECHGDRAVAIGPEGGFTETEVEAPGWRKASLGPRILRIETAALAAL